MEFEKIKTFDQIINMQETSNIEFKRISEKLGNSFWETYSAFANTDGGIIILGVKEGKNHNGILGISDVEKIVKEIATGANNPDLVNKNIYIQVAIFLSMQ